MLLMMKSKRIATRLQLVGCVHVTLTQHQHLRSFEWGGGAAVFVSVPTGGGDLEAGEPINLIGGIPHLVSINLLYQYLNSSI